MRRLLLLATFLLLFLVSTFHAQDIQELQVLDLSGGLVNSIDNKLMQSNMALILENYDIYNFGLRRRQGFTLYNNDAFSNRATEAIFAYHADYTKKDFLLLRSLTTEFDSDTANANLLVLTRCNELTEVCTEVLSTTAFYSGRRSLAVPFNVKSQVINSRLIIAATNSELQIYDGEKVFPSRPRAAGQPYAIALDGGGPVSGIVSYRITFRSDDVQGHHETNMGPPSFPVKVKDGYVFIGEIGPDVGNSTQDTIYIYRSMNGGNFEKLKVLFSFPDGPLEYFEYIDSTAATNEADTTEFTWGETANCIHEVCGLNTSDSTLGPGAMFLFDGTTNAASGYGVLYNIRGFSDSTCPAVVYSVVYIDSAGRQSYASLPLCATFGGVFGDNDKDIKISLTSIPVPRDSSIVTKILLRGLFGEIEWTDDDPIDKRSHLIPLPATNGVWHNVVINGLKAEWKSPGTGTTREMMVDSMKKYINLDTLLNQIVIAIDSVTANDTLLVLISGRPGAGWKLSGNALRFRGDAGAFENVEQKPFTATDFFYKFIVRDTLGLFQTTYTDSMPYDSLDVTPFCGIDSSNAQEPTTFCYDDSNITFQPFDIAYHGSRLWAIGDLNDKNNIWYSDFGRPTTFARDHFISVESQSGDWFNALQSAGELLLMFRQNSVYALQGLSFFQFQLDKIIEGVGLTASRSLVRNRNVTYFAHQTGIYTFPMQPGGLPLSWPIQNTFDSVGESMRRAVGSAVGEEYWISVGIGADSSDNNQTLIYSNNPKPHWKSYSFGIRDMVVYDDDTLKPDYSSDKFIFLHQNDSMMRWNYDPSETEDNGAAVVATYQSKYYLHEGQGPTRREKIWYVDFFGTGTAGELVVRFLEETRGQVDSVTFTPDFTDNKVDRVVFNRISDNVSIGWRDDGTGDYIITGYTIGWSPWDSGRR